MPRHLDLEIPRYLVHRPDGPGRFVFYYQVPRRLRPEGWPGARRLPIDPAERTGLGDTAEWLAAVRDAKALYVRLLAERDALRPQEETLGSLPWLIDRMTADDNKAWTARPASTRKAYRSALKAIRLWSAEIGHRPATKITVPEIVAFLNRFAGRPHMQHLVKACMRLVWRQAKLEGLTTLNPIDRDLPMSPLPKSEPEPWAQEDVDAFAAAAAEDGSPSLARFIRTKWSNGMRNTDLRALLISTHSGARIEGTHVFRRNDGWCVDRNTSKRGRAVIVRLPGDVCAGLDAEIAELTAHGIAGTVRPFLMHRGKAWTESTFDRTCRRILNAIGREHLEIGWLRHTVMTDLDEAGAPDAASAALVGHAPSAHKRLKERHYRIETETLTGQAVEILEAHRKSRSRTKV